MSSEKEDAIKEHFQRWDGDPGYRTGFSEAWDYLWDYLKLDEEFRDRKIDSLFKSILALVESAGILTEENAQLKNKNKRLKKKLKKVKRGE